MFGVRPNLLKLIKNMRNIYLDPKFCPESGCAELKHETFKFSAGEVHIKLKETQDIVTNVTISHRLNSSNDIMLLLLAADAVRRKFERAEINAFIPYLPYARQDRVMVEGEPFSLEVLANVLATAKFNKIYTLDPHSDIASVLIKNLVVMPSYYLQKIKDDIIKNFGDFVIVSPDGGALKKIYKQAELIGYKGNIYCASKLRNVGTGAIIRTSIDGDFEDFQNKTIWIIDDICSRGGTFVALAKKIKETCDGECKVVTSVSHYEGVADENILKQSLDKMYKTNSISDYESDFVKNISIY